MKYTLQWAEKKVTSTGKEKIDATLTDGTNTIDGVTIWSDFPNFATLMAGHTVEGDIVTKQSGQYTNKTLYPIKAVNSSPRATGGFTGGSKLMKEKQEGIKESQERKEEGIKVSASMRDAVTLATAEYVNFPQADLELLVKKWRKFILDNWTLPF